MTNYNNYNPSRFRYNIIEEDLKQLYLDMNLSQEKVAKDLGVSKQVIKDRLKYYNIPIRNNSDASKVRLHPKRKWVSMVMVFCECCGKEILQKPYEFMRKYCSQKCNHKVNKPPILIQRKSLFRIMSFCKNCDKEILHYHSRNKSFCCKRCEVEYYKKNPNYTGVYRLHKTGKDSYCWKGGRKVTDAKNHSRRKCYGFIPLFENPFPEEIDIDYHHINNLLVVPVPRQIHKKCNNGCKVNLHREKCNIWLYYLYGMDFERLLCQ